MYNNSISSTPAISLSTQQRPLETYNAYLNRKADYRKMDERIADTNTKIAALQEERNLALRKIASKVNDITNVSSTLGHVATAADDIPSTSQAQVDVKRPDIFMPASTAEEIMKDQEDPDIVNVFIKYAFLEKINFTFLAALIQKDLPAHYRKLSHSLSTQGEYLFCLLALFAKHVEPKDGKRYNKLIAGLCACKKESFKHGYIDDELKYFVQKYARAGMLDFVEKPKPYYINAWMYNYPHEKIKPTFEELYGAYRVECINSRIIDTVDHMTHSQALDSTGYYHQFDYYLTNFRDLRVNNNTGLGRFHPNVQNNPKVERPELYLPIVPEPVKIDFYTEEKLAREISKASATMSIRDCIVCSIS